MPPGLFDWAFWFQFIYFFAAVFLAFYIPGSLLLKRTSLKFWENLVLSIPIGMTLFGLLGLLLGYLNLRFISYFYLLVAFVLWMRSDKKIKISNPVRIDKRSFIILVIGVIFQIAHSWFWGTSDPKGLFFCCGSVPDNFYHMELTGEITRHIPPYDPDFYGVVVKNYHYLGNVVVAEIVRVFGLNIIHTEFQYFAVLLSLLLGLLSLLIAKQLRAPPLFSRWLLFFLYFGGDFIYIIQLVTKGRIDFSTGPIENGTSLYMNPPRAFALIILFATIALLLVYLKEKKTYLLYVLGFLIASTIGFKIHVGIFALTGLFSLVFYFLSKSNKKVIIPFLLTVFLGSLIYIPVNNGAGGFLFSGFWRFEDFITNPTVGTSRLELARRIYFAHKSWLRVLQYEFIFVLLYFFSQFGTKVLAFFQSKKSLSLFPKELHIFLLSGSLVSFILGGFFLEKTGGGNEFNFVVTLYYIASFYSAALLSTYLKKVNMKTIIISLLIIAATLPRPLFEEVDNMNSVFKTQGTIITKDELSAMDYVKNNTPKNSLLFVFGPAYLNSIGQRDIFTIGKAVEDFHSIKTSRSQIVTTVLQNKNPQIVYKTLISNNIHYLYLSSDSTISANSNSSFKRVYSNKSVAILKVL